MSNFKPQKYGTHIRPNDFVFYFACSINCRAIQGHWASASLQWQDPAPTSSASASTTALFLLWNWRFPSCRCSDCRCCLSSLLGSRNNTSRDDLPVDLLAIGDSYFLRVGIARCIDPPHCRLCNCRTGGLSRESLGRQRDGVFVSFRQVRYGRPFFASRNLLPHLDAETLIHDRGLLLGLVAG